MTGKGFDTGEEVTKKKGLGLLRTEKSHKAWQNGEVDQKGINAEYQKETRVKEENRNRGEDRQKSSMLLADSVRSFIALCSPVYFLVGKVPGSTVTQRECFI